jgi:hypothetical protein
MEDKKPDKVKEQVEIGCIEFREREREREANRWHSQKRRRRQQQQQEPKFGFKEKRANPLLTET